MCRSSKDTADGEPLRCKKCNEPETRRTRQNLANAVKRDQKALESEETVEIVESPDLPLTVESAVAEEVSQLELSEDDESAVAESLTTLLNDPEVVRELAEAVRKERENSENNRAWILGGREDTPENLAIGLAERQKEILLVGSALADRAQEIHRVDIETEQENWRERLTAAREENEKAQNDFRAAHVALEAHIGSMCEKYDVDYDEYESKLNADEAKELKRLVKDKMARIKEQDEARGYYNQVVQGQDDETSSVLDKIAAGNKQAVAEVRTIGEVPVAFQEKIRGAGTAEVFSATIASTFPDEWVKNSNELNELEVVRVTNAERRVHYAPSKEHKSPYTYTWPAKPDERDARFTGWQPEIGKDGNPTGKWEGLKRDTLMIEPTPRTYKKYNVDGTPKGKGWKRGVVVDRGQVIPVWVKDNETDAKSVASRSKASASITVDMNRSERERSHNIQHEFAHRVEDSNPHLIALEKGFIASRTTGPDGKRDPLIRHGIGKTEYVRADNFVKPYMGRDYQEEHEMTEILSMGTESVFGGKHGGLVGIGENKSDPEMRNWILGVYATA